MTSPVEITITGVIPETGKLVFASSTLVRDSQSNAVMLPQEIVVSVTADVEFTVDIPSTNDPEFSPTGWTWEVRPHFPLWKTAFSVAIPYDSPDGEIWFSELVEVPPDGDGDLYALVGHTHEGGGGGSGPSPASTVVAETSYGQASAVGVGTTYARNDHTHGTPALGTSGTTAAAGNHTHTGTYDPAGTAATAVSNHEAAANPHPTYLTAAEGDAAYEVTGAVATHAAAANPHPTYLTEAEADALYEPLGGGGGSAMVVKRSLITSGDVTPQNTSSAWQLLTGGPTLAIAAAVGDYVEFNVYGMYSLPSASMLDQCVIVSAAAVRYSSNGTGTPALEGDPQMYPNPSEFVPLTTSFEFEVEAGDISGGNVTFGFATKSNGTGTLYMSTNYPLRLRAVNYGPVDVS